MRGRGRSEDLCVVEGIILKRMLKKSYLISRWIGTNFGFLCARH